MSVLSFREGRSSDLRATFELGEAALDASRKERGLLPRGHQRAEDDLAARWERERGMLEFIVAQADGSYLICEDEDEMVGYTRIARFGQMDELTELWVAPSHSGLGVGRALLERCWPESPTPELGRVVLGIGRPADLTLYTQFGVMPVSGHWHMRHRSEEYLERRSQEIDGGPPTVHVLTSERAVAEWKRLEPLAIGHERPLLHEFFGRTRNCLATIDPERGEATGPLLGELRRGHRPRRRRGGAGPRAGGARRARPGGDDDGAGERRRVLHDRLVVAARPAAPARLQGALARLGDELGAPAGARPLPGDPPRKIALKGIRAHPAEPGACGQALPRMGSHG